jgi:hypothetical protein
VKTLEYHHGNNWFDQLNNDIARDANAMRTVFSWAWDNKGVYSPADESLFYNGYVMVRITNGGVFLHLRLVKSRRSQFGIGYKLNGRFGLIFRPWQTNTGAAAGAHGPNTGHAEGFDRGTA